MQCESHNCTKPAVMRRTLKIDRIAKTETRAASRYQKSLDEDLQNALSRITIEED